MTYSGYKFLAYIGSNGKVIPQGWTEDFRNIIDRDMTTILQVIPLHRNEAYERLSNLALRHPYTGSYPNAKS
jgi:hypothetical protein